jgi:hypothetical protein
MAQSSIHNSKTNATAPLACIIAGLSMAATPAYAFEVPSDEPVQPMAVFSPALEPAELDVKGFDPEAETASHHRRRHRHRHHRYNHDDGIDGGDILVGALIIGGIAAIASAASNDNRQEQERAEQRRRYDQQANYTNPSNTRSSGGSGIDNAVRQCRSQIERDVRISAVDSVSREASGWSVSGTLVNGSDFSCQINNNGQISSIDYNGFNGAGQSKADGQWSDRGYAAARASLPAQSPDEQTGSARGISLARNDGIDGDARPLVNIEEGQPLPAYPGGPLPSEERRD